MTNVLPSSFRQNTFPLYAHGEEVNAAPPSILERYVTFPVRASRRLRIPVSDRTYRAPWYATSVGRYVPARGCHHAMNSPGCPSAGGVRSPLAPGLMAYSGLPFPPLRYNRP